MSIYVWARSTDRATELSEFHVSRDGRVAARTSRSPEATYDVVVIGAGQAGLAMRYFLKQQQGRKSVILEAAHSIGSATDVPGLYFLGLTWQHTRGSALIGWVKDDAEFIAEQIAAFHEDPGRLADERESAAEDGQAAPAASRERA